MTDVKCEYGSVVRWIAIGANSLQVLSKALFAELSVAHGTGGKLVVDKMQNRIRILAVARMMRHAYARAWAPARPTLSRPNPT